MDKLTINVKKCTILHDKYSADQVFITTDFPTTMPKVSKQSLFFTFQTEQGTGIDYCINNLGITEIENIDIQFLTNANDYGIMIIEREDQKHE